MATQEHNPPSVDTDRKLRRLEAENRRLRRARKALLGAQEASAAVASRLDPREALQEIVEEALKVVDGNAAAIYLIRDGYLEPQAVAGAAEPDTLQVLPRTSVRSRIWRTLRNQGGIIIGDASTSPYLVPARAYVRLRVLKSLLVVPLIARGKVIGMLGVSNRRRRRAFSQEDLRVIRLFAAQAALALDNSNLYADAMDASARLRGQVDIGKAVFDGIRDPVALLNSECRIAFGNRALFACLDLDPSRVIGRNWEDFVDPVDADSIRAQAETADGNVLTGRLLLRRPDGSHVPYLVSAGQSRDSSGRPIGTVVVMVNFEGQGGLDGELLRSHRTVAAMRRLTRAVSRVFDVERLAAQALRSATGLLGIDHGAVHLVEGGELVLVVEQNLGAKYCARAHRIPIEGTISGHAMTTRRPLTFVDIRRSPRLAPAIRETLPRKLRSGAMIPILGRDSAIGVMAFGAPEPSPFTPDAVRLVSILATQFGAAVENARLYQAAQQRAERLAVLNQAAEELISCSEPMEVVPVICRGLAQILDARRVVCFDHDTQKGMLAAVGAYKVPASRWRRLQPTTLRRAPLFALAINERQVTLVEDVARSRGLPEEYAAALSLHAAVAVPVISRKELRGVLLADNGGDPIFLSQDQKDMAMALANQCAITLDNVYLLREERARSQQLSLAVREAHHRIKNNLQAVCDLLELELLDAGGAAASSEGIQHCVQRVQAISLVHEFLSRHHDVATVNVGQVLERLVPLVVASNQRRDQEVVVAVNSAPVTLSSKQTTAVALIVNELVSNAVRHGLNGRPGAVEVNLSERSGTMHLRVADDGAGLPEGFDPRIHGHVGLEISRVLAQRDLGGTIVIAPKARRAHGTVAHVRFPR
jgi:GAF domain-containing protein